MMLGRRLVYKETEKSKYIYSYLLHQQNTEQNHYIKPVNRALKSCTVQTFGKDSNKPNFIKEESKRK
jgi:hypothetical protein